MWITSYIYEYVISWKHFLHYWLFVSESLIKGQWCVPLIFERPWRSCNVIIKMLMMRFKHNAVIWLNTGLHTYNNLLTKRNTCANITENLHDLVHNKHITTLTCQNVEKDLYQYCNHVMPQNNLTKWPNTQIPEWPFPYPIMHQTSYRWKVRSSYKYSVNNHIIWYHRL